MIRPYGKPSRKSPEVAVAPLSEAHFPEVWPLWRSQYEEELSAGHGIPDNWGSHQDEVQCYLGRQAKSGYAMVARSRDETVGYMLFEVFQFHGEETAFSPIVGHAAERSYRRLIFERLYQTLSDRLVAKGILNHVATYFAHDEVLEETVFDLGFGLIVVDAFQATDAFPGDFSNTKIMQADSRHAGVIQSLDEEARSYYLEAPLFLSRKKKSHDYYDALSVEDAAIYLAFADNTPVGVMQIRRNKKLDPITLSDAHTGLIDQIGAYVKPAYRGRGIGRDLLLKCAQWCQHHDITQIHVDFESANLSGRSFWLQYFTPALHSARRAIYPDVTGTQQMLAQASNRKA